MNLNPYDRYALTGEIPNAGQIVMFCCECGEGILEDDIYYEMPEGNYCERCIDNFRQVASYDR